MEELQVRGRRDLKPVFLKLGIALALSIAGYLVSHFRHRPHLPHPPSRPGSSSGVKPPTAGAGAGAGLRDELHILTSEEALAKIISGTSTSTSTSTVTTVMALSPSSKSSGNEEGFLLPEFNQLMLKEFEASGRDPETPVMTPVSKKLEIEEELAMEREIAYLRNLVESLQERERTLEIQMLEYQGLREQEVAVRELENRLKINTTEAKLFSLKMESLQAENRRLQAQVSDYWRTVTELESARAKIRLLTRKLKLEEEQAKENIAALQQRIAMLQHREHEDSGNDLEVEKKVKRLRELEDEAANLRKVNSRLALENSELKLKFKSTQMPTSALKGPEVETLEEAKRLREECDKLKKNIEQLHTDRCVDVEELVYLRWINACLRYELRNYQPPPGKTVARDLSKSLSPKSEQKAKQLIVEYANFSIDERNMSFIDFDLDCCSSQASTEESDDTYVDASSTTRISSSRKSKFFSKLKKLVLGKDGNSYKASSVDRTPTSHGNSERKTTVSSCSFEGAIGRGSNDSFSSCISVELASANQLPEIGSHANVQWQNRGARHQNFSRSLDIHRPRRLNLEELEVSSHGRCKSDVGTSYGYRKMVSGDGSPIDLSPNSSIDHADIDAPEKVELRKFADALKSSRGSPKLKKRVASSRFT